jgi:hypothetical protein
VPCFSITRTRSHGGESRSSAPSRSCHANASAAGIGRAILRTNVSMARTLHAWCRGIIAAVHSVQSLLYAVLVAGCGRVGFDAAGDASVTEPDAFTARICDRYPEALYCNDFEDGLQTLSSFDAMITPAGGVGGSAGLAFSAGPGEVPRVTHQLAMPIESAPFYIAGQFRLAAGPFVDEYVVLVQTTSNVNSKISFDLVDLDTPQLVNIEVGDGGRHGARGSVPRDRWVCYELMIDVSAASAGGVTLSLDGQQAISDWQGFSTLPQGGWAYVELGAFASAANSGTIDVVFDNWVVQTSPIGCP